MVTARPERFRPHCNLWETAHCADAIQRRPPLKDDASGARNSIPRYANPIPIPRCPKIPIHKYRSHLPWQRGAGRGEIFLAGAREQLWRQKRGKTHACIRFAYERKLTPPPAIGVVTSACATSGAAQATRKGRSV